jgi:hypothetical protein
MVFLIQEGCVVSCPFGNFLPIQTNPDGTAKKRRARERIECIVEEQLPEKKWMVRLPNGTTKICAGSHMKFVRDPRFQVGQSTDVLQQQQPIQQQQQQQPETTTVITEPTSTTITTITNLPVLVPPAGIEPVLTSAAAPTNLLAPSIAPVQPTRSVETTGDDSDDPAEFDDITSDEDIVEGRQEVSEDNDHEAVIYECETYDVHVRRQIMAEREKQALIAQKWSVTKTDNKTNKSMVWTICDMHVPSDNVTEYDVIGVRGVNWDRFAELKNQLKGRCVSGKSKTDGEPKGGIEMHLTPFSDLLMTMWPGDWQKQLATLNKQIALLADKRRNNKKTKADLICN